jgi:hypothetical protein
MTEAFSGRSAVQVPDEVCRAELRDIGARRRAALTVAQLEAEPEALTTAVRAAERIGQAEHELREAEQEVGMLRSSALTVVRGATRHVPHGEVFLGLAARLLSERQLECAQKEDALRRVAADASLARFQPGFGLVGLALSGGGIRSATFNLGVLQALCTRGVVDHVDYLSTVSGGGYIGGTLETLLSDTNLRASTPGNPLCLTPGRPDPPGLKYLRTAGQYLAPEGMLDRIRIPALLLRGLTLNLLCLIPYILVAVVFTERVYGRALREALVPGHEFDPWLAFGPAVLLSAALLLWVILFPGIRRTFRLPWRARNTFEQAFSLLLILTIGVSLYGTVPYVLLFLEGRLGRPTIWQGSGVTLGTIATIATPLLPLVFASGPLKSLSGWRWKLVLWSLGLLGPILVLVLYLELAGLRIFVGPGVAVASSADGYWGFLVARLEWIMAATNVIGFDLLDWEMMLFTVVLFLFGWYVVDVNVTSLHNFYRDRLSRAYLFRVSPATGEVEHVDDRKLSELSPPGSSAPYHLVNATLNLQGSRELPGRRADFFLLSKRFYGSDVTDYHSTAALEAVDRSFDYGTAIATSGAAIAPNTGVQTIRILTFVLTLLNVRTGYWLPNPARVKEGAGTFRGVGPPFLLRELFGWLDERSRYVNITDGGHLENLGLYQLLRRRCAYIIVCDAEQDTTLDFGSLARVIRYARMDGGIDINLDLSRLRRMSSGLSSAYYTVGTVNYGGGQSGKILYIKACLTGAESEDIREYRARRGTYPHESTGQQFFDEGQFEAYRALGEHIAGRATRGFPSSDPSPMREWFRALEDAQNGPSGVAWLED